MSPTPRSYNNFIGIDIAKGTFVVAINDNKKTHTFSNHEGGIAEFISTFGCYLKDGLTVVEYTGGYERKVVDALFHKGYDVHKAHAPLVKAFIKSYGVKAKTDSVDAKSFTKYAAERARTLTLYTPRDETQEELRQLVERRDDLVKMRTAEKNRLKGPCQDYVIASIQKLIKILDEEIKEIEIKIDAIISKSYKKEKEILMQIDGIGPVAACTLLAFLPELGRCSHAQIASLVGLAPYANESGDVYKRRHIYGGRAIVRQKLIIGAMGASRSKKSDLGTYYKGLLNRGKRPMVCISATARKMLVRSNAKLRDYYASLVEIKVAA